VAASSDLSPNVEIELKFAVPADRRAALEKALERAPVRIERMQAIYFDTADERLARRGVTLRLRKEGRRWVQTVKAATAKDSFRRLEHNVSVTAPSGGGPPALDLARHDAAPAGEVLREALDYGSEGDASAGLSMRFRTDVRRMTRTIRVAGARVEIALDTGTVFAGDRSSPICELELELKSGRVTALVGLAAQWADRHGLWLTTVSKAERGARLARGEVEGPPVKAVAPLVEVKQGAAAFFVATIESCLAHIFGNASELAAGGCDESFVHQLRIGLRRLRTVLRELGMLVDGIDPEWEPVLRSAFRELGESRDIAVVLPAVRKELDAAGAPSFPDPKPVHRARRPETVVRDPLFQRTLLEVLAFSHEPRTEVVGDDSIGKDVRTLVAQRLDGLRLSVARDGKRFATLDPDRQHRVRKRLKRLRYLSEFAAPLFGIKQVTRYLAAWRQAQDALGEYNDQLIAAEFFRAEAGTEPRAWFAVGWLAARQRVCVKRCKRALRKAMKAPAFW